MPSRYRKKSSSKSISPKIAKTEYYLCPHCKVPGIIVTSVEWVFCGKRFCERGFRVSDHRITEEEYFKVWG